MKKLMIVLLFIFAFASVAASPADCATGATQKRAAKKGAALYICPMDPDVKSPRPGKCPKCGMTLRAATDADVTTEVPMPGAKPATNASERQVEKAITANAAKPDAASSAASPAAENKPKSADEAAAAYFTNTVLLTQDGKPVHFYDDLLKGRVVLINFVFTTCQGVCPVMTANLAKVQEYLGERVGSHVNMISISVDPAVDTPEALKKFAESYKVKSGWYFLTGKKDDVELVLRKLGGYVADKNDHTSLLIIGNLETGQWMKMFAMARPTEIADAVIKIAGTK
ncbi:MAG TPA: SCO family protein [Blastocatellia bacterium]|nr:SCO family protein [Blastocatellia bacterium]